MGRGGVTGGSRGGFAMEVGDGDNGGDEAGEEPGSGEVWEDYERNDDEDEVEEDEEDSIMLGDASALILFSLNRCVALHSFVEVESAGRSACLFGEGRSQALTTLETYWFAEASGICLMLSAHGLSDITFLFRKIHKYTAFYAREFLYVVAAQLYQQLVATSRAKAKRQKKRKTDSAIEGARAECRDYFER